MNRVFQERLDELEIEFLDTGMLRVEEATNKPTILTVVPPNLETRLGSVPAVPQVPQSSSEQGQSSDILDRLGKAPVRRTIEIRQSDSGRDLRPLEIGNDEYEQGGTTSRKKFFDMVETHTFSLARL